MKTKKTIQERFWEKVNKIPDGCWEWTGSLNPSGYGQFQLHTKKPKATHRLAFFWSNGSIPENLWVLHKCHNRKCVNPEHLYLGTPQDNVNDLMASSHHISTNAILTELQVQELRLISDYYNEWELSKIFGVARLAIRRTIKKITWKKINDLDKSQLDMTLLKYVMFDLIRNKNFFSSVN